MKIGKQFGSNLVCFKQQNNQTTFSGKTHSELCETLSEKLLMVNHAVYIFHSHSFE